VAQEGGKPPPADPIIKPEVTMSEKCLNCHFFCKASIDFDNSLVTKSAGPEFRTLEGLDKMLKNRSLVSQSPWSLTCFCGKWDTAKIRTKNIDEIKQAIFSPERDTCDCFGEFDEHATQTAVKESEQKKAEARERRITRILSIIAILIAIGSLIIAFLAYRKP
jgi:hypothetical protein